MRNGHIAMMADADNRVLQEGRLINGKKQSYEQESFLVEVHTIGGYSGSPVFVYFPNWFDLDGSAKEFLLGVEWGAIPQQEPVVNEKGKQHPAGWQVLFSTGMAGVVPAWYLRDLILKHEDLKRGRKLENQKVKQRKETEKKFASRLDSKGVSLSKAEFQDMLDGVSRKTPKSKSSKDSK